MYAIVSNGGRQFMVQEGGLYKIDRVSAEIGAELAFENVLLVADAEKATSTTDAAKHRVSFEVVDHARDKKIHIIKFKRRKHHMKRMGHRQGYTVVKVKSIK
jgi:large subunit ribosomal protein L21